MERPGAFIGLKTMSIFTQPLPQKPHLPCSRVASDSSPRSKSVNKPLGRRNINSNYKSTDQRFRRLCCHLAVRWCKIVRTLKRKENGTKHIVKCPPNCFIIFVCTCVEETTRGKKSPWKHDVFSRSGSWPMQYTQLAARGQARHTMTARTRNAFLYT